MKAASATPAAPIARIAQTVTAAILRFSIYGMVLFKLTRCKEVLARLRRDSWSQRPWARYVKAKTRLKISGSYPSS
jgi:hypothetical protein